MLKLKKEKVEDVSELDDNKTTRELGKNISMLVTIMLTILGFYHLYVGFFGASSAMTLRATHWLFISISVFFIYPARKKSQNKVTYLDWAWAALAASTSLYILFSWKRIAVSAGITNSIDVLFGILTVIVVLEAARRSIGPVLSSLATIFLAYGLWGHLLPGTLGHRAYTTSRVFSFLYTGTEGVFGTAMDVSAKYVALFVLFGALLEKFGGGQLFVDIAYSITGKMRGGPAKAAVVSSALMGTMSGSAVANVVTTGAFTIPLMKKNGYRPKVAAAIEAVASTGGQIMPPVMGAAAFLMAEMTGITYGNIMKAALIPAFLYFFAVFEMVDIEAVKGNIPVVKDSEIKPLKQILKTGGYLILPLALLIYVIFNGYSAIMAASYAIIAILVLDVIFNSDRKNMPKKFLDAVAKGMRSVVSVATACACSGIIVGIISLTGIGSKFSSLMINMAGDNILIALVMTMIASLILGCGLPTTAAYMILATLAVPALTKLNVPIMAAHLFVLYFGSVSTITPPVALSAYAGAALAGANPNEVGYTAFRFGALAFIVPFAFVYQPALLMQGSVLVIILTIAVSMIGTIMIAISMQGYYRKKCSLVIRVLTLVAGICLLRSSITSLIIGAVLVAIFVFTQITAGKKKEMISDEIV